MNKTTLFKMYESNGMKVNFPKIRFDVKNYKIIAYINIFSRFLSYFSWNWWCAKHIFFGKHGHLKLEIPHHYIKSHGSIKLTYLCLPCLVVVSYCFYSTPTTATVSSCGDHSSNTAALSFLTFTFFHFDMLTLQ